MALRFSANWIEMPKGSNRPIYSLIKTHYDKRWLTTIPISIFSIGQESSSHLDHFHEMIQSKS
jgi:hypothetical protein